MPRWTQHYWFQPCPSHSPTSGFPSSFGVAAVVSLLIHPLMDSANTEHAFPVTSSLSAGITSVNGTNTSAFMLAGYQDQREKAQRAT